jgi:hypothetical protein
MKQMLVAVATQNELQMLCNQFVTFQILGLFLYLDMLLSDRSFPLPNA